VAWYTYIAVGGGIFAKTAKTPPLQSGVCGDIVAGDCRTDHHLRPCGHLREGGKANHDAARRVATSFEKRGIGFKPPYSKRGTAAR